MRITEAGQECQRCGTPVEIQRHKKQPKYKPGGYYFSWWFMCPNRQCKAMYMVEAAKVKLITKDG